MAICETERLRLRHLSGSDAEFILDLLNDPDFVRGIGDRAVRTLAEARHYILTGPVASYERFGFGLYLVETRQPMRSIGICGFLRRDSHPDVEIGFAFLPAGRGQGYAQEAATAALGFGTRSLRMTRIVALTALDNQRSGKLLEKLGFQFERTICLAGLEPSRFFVLNIS